MNWSNDFTFKFGDDLTSSHSSGIQFPNSEFLPELGGDPFPTIEPVAPSHLSTNPLLPSEFSSFSSSGQFDLFGDTDGADGACSFSDESPCLLGIESLADVSNDSDDTFSFSSSWQSSPTHSVAVPPLCPPAATPCAPMGTATHVMRSTAIPCAPLLSSTLPPVKKEPRPCVSSAPPVTSQDKETKRKTTGVTGVKRGRKSVKVLPAELDDFDWGDLSSLGKRERNKISASKYRKRRKMYVDSLEAKLQALERKCAQQNDLITSLQSENKVMKEQVSFLQGLVSGKPGNKTKGATMMFVLFSCFLFCSTGSMWSKYHASQPLMITGVDDVSVDGFKGRSLLHVESEAISTESSVAVDPEALPCVAEEAKTKASPVTISSEAPSFVAPLESKRVSAGFGPLTLEFMSPKFREEGVLFQPASRSTAFTSFASLLAASEGKLNVSLSTLERVGGGVSLLSRTPLRNAATVELPVPPSVSSAPSLSAISATSKAHNDCWVIPPLEPDPLVYNVGGIRSLVRHSQS